MRTLRVLRPGVRFYSGSARTRRQDDCSPLIQFASPRALRLSVKLMAWSAAKTPLRCRAEQRRAAMEIRSIGIDLGKTVFHLVGVNTLGDLVIRNKCSRTPLLRFTVNLRACPIGMEACGGSQFLSRA